MPSGAAALPARELTDRRRPDATASRPTPAVDSRLPSFLFDAFLFRAREYHNTSRAVRQTSRKPREDCESDTTPASPFGGTATRSLSINGMPTGSALRRAQNAGHVRSLSCGG